MVVKEFNHVPLLDLLTPLVSRHIDHSAEQFKKEISVIIRLLSKLNVSIHHLFEEFYWSWVELGYVSANFEQKSVSKLKCSLNQTSVLIFLSNQLCITWVSRQINSKSHELLPHNRLWAVNNELINQWDTLSIRECCFQLVFLWHVI